MLLVIDALMAMGCLQQVDVDRFRPVVELTEFGGEVMRGRASLPGDLPIPVDLQRKLHAVQGVGNSLPTTKGDGGGFGEQFSPPRESPPETSSVPLDSPDTEILDSLKQWRAEIANEAGVPLYCILQNATLAELARCRPTTREELLAVKGMGPVKAERYGHMLLEIIRERLTGDRETGRQGGEETGRQGDIGLSPVCPSPPLPVSPSLPSSHWTRRLLAAGFSVDECMAIRGLTARGRLGARPAERAGFGGSTIVGGDSRRRFRGSIAGSQRLPESSQACGRPPGAVGSRLLSPIVRSSDIIGRWNRVEYPPFPPPKVRHEEPHARFARKTREKRL